VIIEEVHLWRGSPEQQALRSRLVKTTQFAYFDEQLAHPDWHGRRVLDFGGNKGNLLLDPACTIRKQDYYCLDVIAEAIAEGRKTFPNAHWFHYDRYNCSFNPGGIVDLALPDFGVEFDFILAYSVFTHTTWEEMKELVPQLQRRLVKGGTLAFTFIDPHSNLRRSLTLSRDARWCSLVNGTDLYVESSGVWNTRSEDCMTYNVYYSREFLREQFPEMTIKEPVNDEIQHCCISRG